MSGAALRELLVWFGVEVDSSQLDEADKKTNSLAGSIKTLFAGLSAAYLINELKNVVGEVRSAGDELATTAQILGVSARELEAWRHGAKLANVEAAEFSDSLTKMQRTAADGGLDKAGIKAKDAAGNFRGINELLPEVADKMASISSETERTAFAVSVFGRSGAKLVPFLSQGRRGLAGMRKELDELGGGLTGAGIDGLGEYDDAVVRLEAGMTSLKANAVVALAPLLTVLTNALARGVPKVMGWVRGVRDWVRHSQPLRNALRFVGVLLGIVAARLAPQLLLRGVVALVAKWGIVRGVLGSVLRVLGRFILRLAIPALLLDDLIVTFQGGDSIIRRILDGWFGEGSTAQVVTWFAGFFAGWDGLTDRVGEFFSFLAEVMNTAAFEVKAAFIGIGASILDGVSGGWNSLIQFAQDSVNKLIGLANKIPFVDMGSVDFSGAKGGNDNAEVAQRALSGERMAQASRLASATDRAFGTNIGGAAVAGAPQINVNVPPGTPATMAERVGKASARGTQQGMKAALAASKQKGA
jgi:hypothetical protein